MRHTILLLSMLFFFACGNPGPSTNTNSNSNSSPAPAPANDPPPAPALPANLSVPDLRNEVRNVLRMQLPLTYPEQRNGQLVEKSYSFDVEAYERTGRPMWVITEKLHEPVSDQLQTAGQSSMPKPSQD